MKIQGRPGRIIKMKMLIPTMIFNINSNRLNFIESEALKENKMKNRQKYWTHFIAEDDYIHSSRQKYQSSGIPNANGTDHHASKRTLCLCELGYRKEQTCLPWENVKFI
jgi:hypothetical protein